MPSYAGVLPFRITVSVVIQGGSELFARLAAKSVGDRLAAMEFPGGHPPRVQCFHDVTDLGRRRLESSLAFHVFSDSDEGAVAAAEGAVAAASSASLAESVRISGVFRFGPGNFKATPVPYCPVGSD